MWGGLDVAGPENCGFWAGGEGRSWIGGGSVRGLGKNVGAWRGRGVLFDRENGRVCGWARTWVWV